MRERAVSISQVFGPGTLERPRLPKVPAGTVEENAADIEVLTYADVEVPAGRLCDKLRAEQNARFFGKGTPQVEVVASKARARRAATVSSPS